jgi:hypothetical protein
MDPRPSDVLDMVIASLKRIPSAWLSENQRWHVYDAIETLSVAREECCLNRAACSDCDAQCGDLRQP